MIINKEYDAEHAALASARNGQETNNRTCGLEKERIEWLYNQNTMAIAGTKDRGRITDKAVLGQFHELETKNGYVTLRALVKICECRQSNQLTGPLNRLEAAGLIERHDRIYCKETHRLVNVFKSAGPKDEVRYSKIQEALMMLMITHRQQEVAKALMEYNCSIPQATSLVRRLRRRI